MSKTKQKSSAAKNVAVFFVVFIILELLILFGVSRVFKNKDVTPSFAGYSVYIMNSDAMGSEVPKDSLVFAANGAPSVDGIGKAVLAENVPGVGTSVFWLGKVSNGADMNGVVYTLFQQNDPNVAPTKSYQVKSSDIVGTAMTYYRTAGKVIKFITSTFGMAVCVIVPLFLLVLIELIIAIATHSSSKKDEDDEDDIEEENVTLDDFLFGGENEKNLQKQHSMKHAEKLESAENADAPDDTPSVSFAKEETPAENTEQEEAPETDAPAEEAAEEKPEIDKTYYEKAAKLLDDAVVDTAETVEETASKAAPEAEKPADKPVETAPSAEVEKTAKSASASLEELMKLMEEEQKKLRDSLNK